MSDRPALILVGHGTSVEGGGAPLAALAGRLEHSGRFAGIHVAFLRQEPRLGPVESLTDAARVVIVPVMAGGGALSGPQIERSAGLDGRLTERGGRRIRLTPPVGSHPAFADLVERRARAEALAWGRDPSVVALLLLAHGSSRPGGAGEDAQALAAVLAGRRLFARVACAFLQQAPYAADWRDLVGGLRVVALPLLLSAGTHARRDLPAVFGRSADHVRLAPPLGDDPGLDALVLDLALAG